MYRVLIVDDERSIRETLSEFLRADGHSVETAGTLDEAASQVQHQPVDVVIADILLPGGSGLDVLDLVKAAHPTAQVILITGEPTLDSATRGLRSGAFDYLAKPVTGAQVRLSVQDAAATKAELDRKARLESENREYQERLAELVEERSQQLKESEDRFRSFVEYSSDAILLTDEKGILIEWNPAAERIFGIPRCEAIGKGYVEIECAVSVADSDPSKLAQAVRSAVTEALSSGQAHWLHRDREATARTPAGEIRRIQSRTFPIRTSQGYRLGSIIRDVTPSAQPPRG